MAKIVYIAVLVFVGGAWGYSGGAPEDVCEDMTPKHPVDPQKSALPYQVKVDKSDVKPGEKVNIIVSGGKPFKGYLIQVRDGDKAVGSFNILSTDKYSKTIDCHGKKQNSATHKNSSDKKSVTLEWIVPADAKKTYTVYVTIAENGGVFWARVPTTKINVN